MPPTSESHSHPRAMEERYRAITALTDAICREHLSGEYADLARRAVAALCRKRPSPLLAGQTKSWACGVLYALGQMNFLSDSGSKPHMTLEELCRHFGVSPSTGGNKAKTVRSALNMRRWDHRWMLPSEISGNPLVWLVELNGLAVDARELPRAIQEHAYERGLIPYIPADREGPEAKDPRRRKVLQRYDRYRRINTQHQTALAERLLAGSAADIAVRLGLIGNPKDVSRVDLSELAPALDLALYATEPEGTTAVQRYAGELDGMVTKPEQRVLAAMTSARFSIYRVSGQHETAGVRLVDLASGEDLWLMDRGLEASASEGLELALRLFRPDDFWMTTGISILMDSEEIWHELERAGLVRRRNGAVQVEDRDGLAEGVYRTAIRLNYSDA